MEEERNRENDALECLPWRLRSRQRAGRAATAAALELYPEMEGPAESMQRRPGQKNKGPQSRGGPPAEAETIQTPTSGGQRAGYSHEREAELNNDMFTPGARGITVDRQQETEKNTWGQREEMRPQYQGDREAG